MKTKLLLTFAVLALAWLPQKAFASTPTYEIEYSTIIPMGVICTTGTVAHINITPPPGWDEDNLRIAGYSIQNQDDASPVWIGGENVTISEADGLSTLGFKLAAGSDVPWQLGHRQRRLNLGRHFLGCKADDAAGAAGVLLNLTWYAY